MQLVFFRNIKLSIKISFLCFISFYSSIYGATWYSDVVGGNPNDLLKWWSKSNGTGSCH